MKTLTKRLLSAFLCLLLVLTCMQFIGCGKFDELVIYNCQDYIDEDLLEDFKKEYKEKHGVKLKIKYDCFDTLENMYSNVKINPDTYDLICPSDYMIEKMAREGMLEELSLTDGEYKQYVSPYIDAKLKSISFTTENGTKSLADYAAGYMWGTIGIAYNPETVNEEDVKSWNVLWNDTYNKKFTIKDSVRDTYFVGLAKAYNEELYNAKSAFELNNDLNAYQTTLSAIFNNTSVEAVGKVKEVLKTAKTNCYAMEVDSGKDSIIKGDTDIYVAWSGDGVYALDEADEEEKTLNFIVPEEGSNVWYDGWCIVKNAKNKAIAQEFINFMSRPSNVIKNMEYIGYVSCVGGQEIFNWVKETYGEDDGEFSVDLSYFFGEGSFSVSFSEENRQFSAQYPDISVINRCVGMNYYPNEANERINNMWQEIKA
ncbi:MAG: extracellular solute-binding protein [Clostridia bacterium]|nr:extracellular solute-binding protein [Clostridia bacterium]